MPVALLARPVCSATPLVSLAIPAIIGPRITPLEHLWWTSLCSGGSGRRAIPLVVNGGIVPPAGFERPARSPGIGVSRLLPCSLPLGGTAVVVFLLRWTVAHVCQQPGQGRRRTDVKRESQGLMSW